MPDVIQLLTEYLRAELPGVQVGARVPSPRPTQFVLVHRLGGTHTWPVRDTPTIGLEAWAGSDPAAYRLCMDARAALWRLRHKQLADGTQVYRVQEYAGPASLPDPLSAQPRYVATLAMTIRTHMEQTA